QVNMNFLVMLTSPEWSDKLAAALGQTGLNIIGRICGMILSALGIEFIYTSLKAMFPAWIG
ncbi:MAG: hypothetical protein J6L82_09520, partial [Alphaproteobacteria bacterium]|nr:hypothetical protein [Alphaproteobacteria bacterium]